MESRNDNEQDESFTPVPHKLVEKPSRFRFSREEDKRLLSLVKTAKSQGRLNWNIISADMPDRTSRQCRERYCNYLSKLKKKERWTRAEDAILIKGFEQLGPNWVSISAFLDGRTNIDCKNHYFSIKRKYSDYDTVWTRSNKSGKKASKGNKSNKSSKAVKHLYVSSSSDESTMEDNTTTQQNCLSNSASTDQSLTQVSSSSQSRPHPLPPPQFLPFPPFPSPIQLEQQEDESKALQATNNTPLPPLRRIPTLSRMISEDAFPSSPAFQFPYIPSENYQVQFVQSSNALAIDMTEEAANKYEEEEEEEDEVEVEDPPTEIQPIDPTIFINPLSFLNNPH